MTYGIRTGESVLITAQEGVGKTEVMHSIEHQLLTETDDAIVQSSLKNQSVDTYKRLQAFTCASRYIYRIRVSPILKQLGRYRRLLELMIGFICILTLVQMILTAFSMLFGLGCSPCCRYILLDHLTMAVSGLGGVDERTALDYLSTRLEMMVKELDFSLIVVSHVNDNGLTRGSRNISKIADIRIDLGRGHNQSRSYYTPYNSRNCKQEQVLWKDWTRRQSIIRSIDLYSNGGYGIMGRFKDRVTTT